MKLHRTVAALAILALLLPAAADARRKKASTEPGEYEDWKGDIDQLEIVQTFSMADYPKIYIAKFDSSDTELPEKDDNTYEPVLQVLASPEPSLIRGLREEMEGVTIEQGTGRDGLVVETVVLEMDPGSQAARYWAGFGAGAARTKLQIVVKDGRTGKVLLRITQERRSGVGLGGGGYVELLNRNLRAIGEDLALVLNAF